MQASCRRTDLKVVCWVLVKCVYQKVSNHSCNVSTLLYVMCYWLLRAKQLADNSLALFKSMNLLVMPPKHLLQDEVVCHSFAGLTTYQHLRYEIVMVFIWIGICRHCSCRLIAFAKVRRLTPFQKVNPVKMSHSNFSVLKLYYWASLLESNDCPITNHSNSLRVFFFLAYSQFKSWSSLKRCSCSSSDGKQFQTLM